MEEYNSNGFVNHIKLVQNRIPQVFQDKTITRLTKLYQTLDTPYSFWMLAYLAMINNAIEMKICIKKTTEHFLQLIISAAQLNNTFVQWNIIPEPVLRKYLDYKLTQIPMNILKVVLSQYDLKGHIFDYDRMAQQIYQYYL